MRAKSKSGNSLIIALHGWMGTPSDFSDDIHLPYSLQKPTLPFHDEETDPENLEGFLDQLSKKIDEQKSSKLHLIGYSLGGRLACQFVNKRSVSSLTLISAKLLPYSEEEKIKRVHWVKMITHKLEKEPFDVFLKNWYTQPIFQTLSKQPDLLGSLLQKRMLLNPERLKKAFLMTQQLNQTLDSITCPIHYITGSEDAKYLKEACDLKKHFPKMKLTIIQGASHAPHIEKPVQTYEAIRSFYDPDHT